MIVTRSIKWLLATLITLTAISIVAVVYGAASRQRADDEDQQETVQTYSHMSVENGTARIALDAATQAREGIRIESLTAMSRRAELRATSVLIPVSSLAALRNNYVAAKTKVERDRVDLATSRNQYERTKTLYEDDQNLSLQAMQNAEATYRNIQAQVTADEQNVNLQQDTIRLNWGNVIEGWVSNNRPMLDALLDQREFLAQVVFAPGEVAAAPRSLWITAPGNKLLEAGLVSPMPQVDAQIQGISFLYTVPSRPGLAVGMNLAVLVPVGSPVRGLTIPQSAIVWWEGKAWVYKATSPTAFTRYEVATENPVTGGYFVSGAAYPSGMKVVTAGAQLLLSEEFRSQIQEED